MKIKRFLTTFRSKQFVLSVFAWGAVLAAVFTIGPESFARAGDAALEIHPPGGAPIIEITEAQVRALPSKTITTLDPWDNKERSYTGCSLIAFLEKMGAPDFKMIHIIAVNDYHAKITRDFLKKYDYLLTHAMDGKDYSELGEDDKGPLAIAVKYENVDRADRIKVKNQLVWWIDRIEMY